SGWGSGRRTGAITCAISSGAWTRAFRPRCSSIPSPPASSWIGAASGRRRRSSTGSTTPPECRPASTGIISSSRTTSTRAPPSARSRGHPGCAPRQTRSSPCSGGKTFTRWWWAARPTATGASWAAHTRRPCRWKTGARRAARARLGAREGDTREPGGGGGAGIVRVDGQGDGLGIVRRLAEDPPVIVDDVAPLQVPVPPPALAPTRHDEGHRGRLAALHDGSYRQARVPHIADQPRAQEGGEARPDDEEVAGGVGGRALPEIGAPGQGQRLPLPLQQRGGVERHLDFLGDGRMVRGAPELQRAPGPVLHHGEVVG